VRKGERPVDLRPYTALELEPEMTRDASGKIVTTYRKVQVERFVKLYAFDQTYFPRWEHRSIAYVNFFHFFAVHGSRVRHIEWDERKGHWANRIGPLTLSQIKNHLNQTAYRKTGAVKKYGVVAGKQTRFQLIDHDLHGGDRDIFIRQAEVLLNHFIGRETWHVIVANEHANGLHLVRVLPNAVDTTKAIASLQAELRQLDAAHPELTVAAVDRGMKCLAQLEIFPNPSEGVRLPLCHGRTALLDRPLELVENRNGRPVQDVLGYVGWLLSKDRTYMKNDDVLQFVNERLKFTDSRPHQVQRSTTTSSVVAPSPSDQPPKQSVRRKGQQARIITDFWDGGGQFNISLNEAINEMARIMAHHPDFTGGEIAACEVLEQMVEELPNYSVSQRTAAGDWALIEKVIRERVHAAFAGNSGQPDVENSTNKLQAVCQHWSDIGYYPWEKASRLEHAGNEHPKYQQLQFSPGHLLSIDNKIAPLLQTSPDTARNLMNYFINFVFYHQREISTYKLVKQILNSFGVKAGNNKLAGFMKLLREQNWIYVKTEEQWHPDRKGRARSYGVGEAAIMLFKNRFSSSSINPPPLHLFIVSSETREGIIKWQIPSTNIIVPPA